MAIQGIPGLEVFERSMTADEAARFRPAEAQAHADRVNPRLRPNDVAFHGDGRYGAPPNPTVSPPPAARAAPARASTLRRATSAVGNGLLYGGAGVGGALAARSMRDVGAPTPTSVVVGERQSGDSANSVLIPTGGTGPAPDAQPHNFWTDTEVGRNVGNAANAVAPLGGLAMAARVPGAASRAFGMADAAVTGLASGVRGERTATPTTATLPDPSLRVRPEDAFAGPPSIAAGGGPGGAAAAPTLRSDVTRVGNSYSGGPNITGPITINGQQPGSGTVSPQNMAAANNLTAADSLRSQGAALGGQPAGGSGIPAMPPTLHSGNSWEARNNLRNLEVSASSIYNSRSHWGNKAKAAADAAAFQNAQAMDTAARTGSDPGSVSRTNAGASMFNAKTAAEASKENSRNSLRGTMYTADAQLGAKQLEMQQRLRQQQLMGSIYEAAGGDPVKAAKLAASYGLDSKSFQDMAAADQTRGFNASKNASSRLESLAVTRNDKGEEVVSPGRLARVNSMVTKMAPNFSQMDEESQTKALRQVEAGVNLLEGINDRRNNGFLQMIGWDGDSPSLDNLPDMKGGKLKTVGALEGATTGGGVARKDYVIELGGHKLYLPRPKVNQGELELLKARGVDISGIDK